MSEQFSTLFSTAINDKGLTNLEVAQLLGFGNANVISMIKAGKMQLPENKLLATSTHLGIPPTELLNAWCHARGYTDILALIKQGIEVGQLTEAERNWLALYRSAFAGRDVDIAQVASTSAPELNQALLLLVAGIGKLHQKYSTE